MALQTAVGQLVCAAGSTGNKSVTGLAFQPKAVIIYSAQMSTTGSYVADGDLIAGFAASSTQRGTINITGNQGSGTQTTAHGQVANAVVQGMINGASAVDFLADFVSFNSDGFTINVSNAPTGAVDLNYIAFGGSDITNAWVGTVTLAASGATQSYTAPGFQPDAMFTMYARGNGTGGLFMLGAASSASDEGVSSLWWDDATANMDCGKYQRSDRSLAWFSAGGALDAEANLASFDTNGWTWNVTDLPPADRDVIVMCIKGGQWKVGAETEGTSAAARDTTLSFTPTGLFLFGMNEPAGTTAVTNVDGKFSVGASDGTNEATVWIGEDDGNGTNQSRKRHDEGRAFWHASPPTPTTNNEADCSFATNKFTLTWTQAGASREFIYVAAGSTAGAVAYSLDCQPGSYTLTGTAATPVAARMINAAPASYAFTGVAATVGRALSLDAASGSYAVTGSASTLAADRTVNAQPASYAVTGAAATLARGLFLGADPATYAVTGTDATFLKTSVMSADPGSYAVTGSAATVAAGLSFNAQPGAYTISGTDAGLDKEVPGQYDMNAEPAVFALTGTAATTAATRLFTASPGAITVTGTAATVGRELSLNAVAGAYTLAGVAATFALTRALSVDPAAYMVTGAAAEMRTEGQAPNMDEILTGWIALPSSGGSGGGTTGRISGPETGGIA